MLIVTITIVKSKYLPIRGTTSEVAGMISTSSKKNTVSEIKIEIDSVTCTIDISEASASAIALFYLFTTVVR